MNSNKIKEQIKIQEYLNSIGLFPTKEKGDDVWFLSPFRKEQNPSFKVNKVLNLWYDHGLGKGGSIIDLVMLLHEINFDEAIKALNEFNQKNIFSFHRQENNLSNIGNEKEKSAGQNTSVFQLKSISVITDIHLVEYIEKRAVQLQTARTFCHQLEIFNSRENFSFQAIGFKNRGNGFEIRTPNFKACYAPKDFSFIDNDHEVLAIVEGFFDLLSAYENRNNLFPEPTNWLVLNSLNQTEKTEIIIHRHRKVYTLLDNDEPGDKGKQTFLSIGRKLGKEVIDLSHKYTGYKDINEWAIQQRNLFLNHKIKEEEQQQEPRRKRGFGR